MDEQIRHRFDVLTWAVGITAGLAFATLAMTVMVSYQLGHIAGQLFVLISYVQWK